MCLRARERERGTHHISYLNRGLCVWERKRDRHISYLIHDLCVCVCVCVCVRERERERERQGHITAECRVLIAACLQTHTRVITVYVTRLFHSRAWTDDKTKFIINCLYFHFESWSSQLWKGALHFRHGTMQCASWPIRADCLSEGGTL